jgi:hypothetical protein
MNFLRLGGHALGLAVTAVLMTGIWSPAAADPISFKEEVFPILEIRCLACHRPGGAGYEKSGLDMRTYEGLMQGTNHGPMIIPGSIIESNLIAMIDRRTSSELWMPHGKKQLSKCERRTIRFWVAQGARNN